LAKRKGGAYTILRAVELSAFDWSVQHTVTLQQDNCLLTAFLDSVQKADVRDPDCDYMDGYSGMISVGNTSTRFESFTVTEF
jgi:hypothetical protein